MENFDDKIKRDFSLSDSRAYTIRFTGDRLTDDYDSKLKSNVLTLTRYITLLFILETFLKPLITISDDLKRIFEPIVTPINKLIERQNTRVQVKRREKDHEDAEAVKASQRVDEWRPRPEYTTNSTCMQAIFMVGGFGSNRYLKEYIQKMHPKIQVIEPHNA